MFFLQDSICIRITLRSCSYTFPAVSLQVMYSYKRHQGLIWQPVLGKLDSETFLRAFAVFISCKKSLALLVWGDLCRKFLSTLSWKTLVILFFPRADKQIGEVNLNQMSWFCWWHKFEFRDKSKCSRDSQTPVGVFPFPLSNAFTLWQLSSGSWWPAGASSWNTFRAGAAWEGLSWCFMKGVWGASVASCLLGSVQPFPCTALQTWENKYGIFQRTRQELWMSSLTINWIVSVQISLQRGPHTSASSVPSVHAPRVKLTVQITPPHLFT